MSSPMSSSATVAWFNNLNMQINRYLPLPFLVFGTIGIILNSVIFTRRNLIRYSCTHYLLGNTIANFVVLYWVTISRLFSDGYKIDPSTTVDGFCKIRYFLTYVSRTLSTWFIVLACVDRWISSIQVHPRFCTVKFARWIIMITTVMCIISFSHIFGYFGIQKTINSTTCYAPPGSYRIFSDFQYLVFYALGPPLAMLGFGLATLRNFQRVRAQVHSNGDLSVNQPHRARHESQILAMLLMQIAMILVFTTPFAVAKLYEAFTTNVGKSPEKIAEENLAAATVRVLSYGSHAFGFFVYTLSARIFRLELLKIYRTFHRQVRCRNSNIAVTSSIAMAQMNNSTTFNAR